MFKCFGAASPYLLAAAIGLITLYGILLGLYYLLGLLGICDTDNCKVALIHVLVLGPLGVILGVLAFLFGGGIPAPYNPFAICFNQGVWWFYGIINGFWTTVLAGCALRS